MSGKIRVAVIGVGSMGYNHARVYASMTNAKLIAVADVDTKRTQMVADNFGVKGYTSYEELLDTEKPEAISIAVPTSQHIEVAEAAINRKIHFLVEKPIASSVEEAERIVTKSQEAQLHVMVGHIERFNPAIIELKKRLETNQAGRILAIYSRRHSPYPGRINDVGVAIDLAVHELDIMRYLIGSEIKRVYAEIRQVVEPNRQPFREDLVFGTLCFTNDTLGILDVNWITPTKTRQIYLTGEKGMFFADYMTQELSFFENGATRSEASYNWMPGQDLMVNEGDMIRYRIVRKEPLKAELESFIQSILLDQPCSITGQDGMKALELAHLILKSGHAISRISL